MRNKGSWKSRRQRGKIQLASRGFCICLKCGYSIPHVPGNPCRNKSCPVCHLPLNRSNNDIQINIANTNDLKIKTMDIPKVNTDICTGCGACIDICPMEAISLKDEKAFIDEDKCSNCLLCESECPVEAIN